MTQSQNPPQSLARYLRPNLGLQFSFSTSDESPKGLRASEAFGFDVLFLRDRGSVAISESNSYLPTLPLACVRIE